MTADERATDHRNNIPLREWDGRGTLRSLADALAKLRDLDAIGASDLVTIKTRGVAMPDGRSTGFVAVVGPYQLNGVGWRIAMPSSCAFSACTTFGERITRDIAALDSAVSDADGNVQLVDGCYVYAVDLVPANYLRGMTAQQEAIVECAIKLLGAEDRCYAPIHESLPPDVQLLRYENVAQVRVSRLKWLQDEIRKSMPGYTDSFITNTLKLAGMRFPRSHRACATISPQSN